MERQAVKGRASKNWVKVNIVGNPNPSSNTYIAVQICARCPKLVSSSVIGDNIYLSQCQNLKKNILKLSVEWFYEDEQFYEDRQDLLELTPKKDVLFIIGDWNVKVASQEIPGVTGKFGLGVQNEAGQRLTEFCKENTLVIAKILFQQHKRQLYIRTSPDGQY